MKKFAISVFLTIFTLSLSQVYAIGNDNDFTPIDNGSSNKSYAQVVHPTDPGDILKSNEAARKAFEAEQQKNIHLLETNLENLQEAQKTATIQVGKWDLGAKILKDFMENMPNNLSQESKIKASMTYEQLTQNMETLRSIFGVDENLEKINAQIENTQKALNTILPPSEVIQEVKKQEDQNVAISQGFEEKKRKLTKAEKRKLRQQNK